jgi:hypothetical protein
VGGWGARVWNISRMSSLLLWSSSSDTAPPPPARLRTRRTTSRVTLHHSPMLTISELIFRSVNTQRLNKNNAKRIAAENDLWVHLLGTFKTLSLVMVWRAALPLTHSPALRNEWGTLI